jgi:cyclic pyranopterin phosphate synthase
MRGKIQFNWMEVHLSSHCNIRCNGCTHHSPFASKRFYELAQFEKDFSALARVSRVNLLWHLGGEPLLHPQVAEFLEKSRKIGFSRVNAISTNGLLLGAMNDRFFDAVDYIFVALYPHFRTKRDGMEAVLKDKGASRRFTANIVDRAHFYQIETDARQRLSDAEAQASYANCDRAKKGQFVEDGYFYKCMRPVSTREYLVNRGHTEALPDFRTVDGVAIHEPFLKERIEAYMASKKCLESCHYCTMGLKKEARQTVWRRCKALMEKLNPVKHLAYRSRRLLYWSHVIQDVFEQRFARKIRNQSRDIGVPLIPHRLLSREEVAPLGSAASTTAGE